MDNKLIGITTFAVLVEGIITYTNQFIVDNHFCWKMLLSLVLGVIIAISYDLDVPSYFNLNPKIPFIGNILTGILLSRGSNYIFDLLESLK